MYKNYIELDCALSLDTLKHLFSLYINTLIAEGSEDFVRLKFLWKALGAIIEILDVTDKRGKMRMHNEITVKDVSVKKQGSIQAYIP